MKYFNLSMLANSFFLVSKIYHCWSIQFIVIIKVLSVFEHNFFILKFHGFILLLNLIIFKYSFFRRIIQVWYRYFQICLVFGQFPGKHFLYLQCTGSACYDCTEGSGSSTPVVFESFFENFTFLFLNFQQYPLPIS